MLSLMALAQRALGQADAVLFMIGVLGAACSTATRC